MKRFVTFKSALFKEVPGEEEETNPGCISKELAEWLAQRLPQHGVPVPELIPEDWGRCLMTQRKPFWLWVGCNAYEDRWLCFVEAELGPVQRFIKRIDPTPDVSRVCDALREVLEAEPEVTEVQWIDEKEM